ncbi:MAG: DUF1553 domain-containing protein [Gemmataceae bacterium]|nr:DUF1553 domain-containing protein [Gemmataceae bacterium]
MSLKIPALATLVVLGSYAGLGAAAVPLEYNRDIRPILAENCFPCHGPDSAARKAGLRLDRGEDALKAGVFVPGKPGESHLIERVFSADAKQVMPPVKTHKVLTAVQKEVLKRWVAEGAGYQLHWSFLLPKKPVLPQVKNNAWVRNPIDRFILAGLEKAGLSPAAEASKETLARRLSLDLTGLPPGSSMLKEFLADTRPDAYERFVDKLLESPAWGEQRGRYWLDAARYADTHGIHFDNFREMWSYRDWVIQALNANMPFDQFTLEQLAGDLLPQATLDQKIATGFNRCNITTNEGGAISEEYLVLYTRDRTETVSQVWLGLTFNCAVCHDHKFDPLSTKDFYSLSAFFNNTTQGAMDGNIKDTPPILPVPQRKDLPLWQAKVRDLEELNKRLEERKVKSKGDFDKWLCTAKADALMDKFPTKGLVASAKLQEGKGQKITFKVNGQDRVIDSPDIAWAKAAEPEEKALQVNKSGAITLDDVGDFERDQPFSFGAWVLAPRQPYGPFFARMDVPPAFQGWDFWYENGKFGMNLISSWNGSAIKVLTKAGFNPNVWHHAFVTYDGSSKAEGIKVYVNGVPQIMEIVNNNLTASTRTKAPFRLGSRQAGDGLQRATFHDLRIYNRALAVEEVAALGPAGKLAALIAKPAAQRTPAENNQLFDWWISTLDESSIELAKKSAQLDREEKQLRSLGTVAHVMNEKPETAMAFILQRGEYDRRKDKVSPFTPQVLPAMAKDLPRNRLGFAKWLLSPEHPLTSRVTVNRFWQEIFGQGLVRTTGDFGVTGELPSHPELLDWLALEFQAQKWDIKKFFKMLVTSAAYRQSAQISPEKLAKDLDNRLLSRGARYRLDAEVIRDYALASSGLLVRKVGGPSVRPYQPPGVWEAVAMIGSNTRDYKTDIGENLYRRSMYTFWKRAAPPASMEILNAPNRETCAVRRERTNTPLQALVTLNDPQFVEAARFLGERAMRDGGKDFSTRLDFVSTCLVARKFTLKEKDLIQNEFQELLAYYQKCQEDAGKLISFGDSKADAKLDRAELAAWTLTINSLMNLDEVLTR